MLYHQSLHKNFEDKERKKHTSNLIQFFIFQISTFWSDHTISIILYSTNTFHKKNLFFFIIFKHDIFSFSNTSLF